MVFCEISRGCVSSVLSGSSVVTCLCGPVPAIESGLICDGELRLNTVFGCFWDVRKASEKCSGLLGHKIEVLLSSAGFPSPSSQVLVSILD